MIGEALEGLGDVVPVTTAQDFVENIIGNMEEARENASVAAENVGNAIAEGLDRSKTEIENGAKDIQEVVEGTVKTLEEDLLGKFSSATKQLSTDLAEGLMAGKDGLSAFKDFFKTIVKELIAQAIRLLVIQPILQGIFGMFGYNIGFGATGNIENITKRAAGGPVMRNKPYVVGELGPELFVPNQAGEIRSASELSGMGSRQTVNYNINAVDAASFKQLVARDPEFIYRVTQAGQRRTPA